MRTVELTEPVDKFVREQVYEAESGLFRRRDGGPFWYVSRERAEATYRRDNGLPPAGPDRGTGTGEG